MPRTRRCTEMQMRWSPFGIESPVLAGRLRALLEHLGITAAPWYRIKDVPRLGWVEIKAITEIFFRSRVLC
jgi:hypothetical protein